MKVAIAAGAEIDLATPDEIKKMLHDHLKTISPMQPIRRKPKGAVVIPTPTALSIIDLGSPPQGRYWEARHVTISGIDPTVAPSGSGYVCIGAPELPQTGTTLDPFLVWSGSTSLPADVSYSRDQAVIVGSEHLFVVISGGTAAAQYAAHAMVFEYIMADKEVLTA